MKEKRLPANQDLKSLLSCKIDAFEEFHTATVLLGQTIGKKDIAKIETMVNLRESQIESINRIDREISKISGGNLMSARSANKSIDELFLKLEEIMRKTQISDSSFLGPAMILLRESSDALTILGRGLNAIHGYGDKKTKQSRFLDVKY